MTYKSSLNIPNDEPIVIIRSSLVELTGCATQAALLNYFDYWHNIKRDSNKAAYHRNSVANRHGEPSYEDISLLQWHTFDELTKSMLTIAGKTKIKKAIATLEERGFISKHRNPKTRYKFDRTVYYQFHPNEVNHAIAEMRMVIHRSDMTHGGVNSSHGDTQNDPPIPETTTEITNKDYTHIEDPLAAEESDSSGFGDLSHEELPNRYGQLDRISSSVNGNGSEPKRKSSAKKKKVEKPRRNKQLGDINEAGYLIVPTKGRDAACGALALRIMQCELIAGMDGAMFENRGDRVMVDLQWTALDGYGEFETGYIYAEDFVLRNLPMGMIQNLNDSDDDRAFNFSVDWYNERLSHWWNEVARIVNSGEATAKQLNDHYRGHILFDVFGRIGQWFDRDMVA